MGKIISEMKHEYNSAFDHLMVDANTMEPDVEVPFSGGTPRFVQVRIDKNLEGIVFGRNQGDLPAAFFDHCLEGFGVDEDGDGFHGPNPVSKQP